MICGIQTNMCVETTARIGLGKVGRSADELMASTALVLQGGGFAKIATTAEVLQTVEHN